jgi:hypothetical protein
MRFLKIWLAYGVAFMAFIWLEGSIRYGHLLGPTQWHHEFHRFIKDAQASALSAPKD